MHVSAALNVEVDDLCQKAGEVVLKGEGGGGSMVQGLGLGLTEFAN
jgi:hypothetical protein